MCAENGPYSLTHNLTLEDNPYGWDLNANVIYVDQPINTGFSWSDVSKQQQQQQQGVSLLGSSILELGPKQQGILCSDASNSSRVAGVPYLRSKTTAAAHAFMTAMWPACRPEVRYRSFKASLVWCGAHMPVCVQDPRDDVSGEKQVADDMLQFLQEFFEGEPLMAGGRTPALYWLLRPYLAQNDQGPG